MSVTAVEGFVAAGVAAGIKASGAPDLAYVGTADGVPVAAAGVFTRNQMTAAPVIVCREHLAATGGRSAGVVLNSGNANAATGAQGLSAARQMCATAAEAVGVASESILVCSTGLIGFQLPLETICAAIPTVVAAASPSGGDDAADAIMTTDTVPKTTVVAAEGVGTVGGIAKGAAMLQPDMATMLAVLTTDIAAEPQELTAALRRGVANSFNTLTVDGAESTNDTVLLLSSGLRRAATDALDDLVAAACRDLAVQMADDAEGSTKTVFVRVSGAHDDAEAAHVARSIANCQLVKCSWYGKDPYWGRIAAEAGSSATHFAPEQLVISYGGTAVYDHGEPVDMTGAGLEAYMERRRLDLEVDLGQGTGAAEIVTTDLSHAYIDENMGTS